MKPTPQYNEAIRRIDEAHEEDPRKELDDGRLQPRERLFAARVDQWVRALTPSPSEELLLAARAHTLRRWLIPRDRFPRTVEGYHQWRDALARFHADEAEAILRGVGYAPDMIRRVRAFITKENWPSDPEACTLEDADCLVFLETKLEGYVDAWGERKTLHILERTIQKMTTRGRSEALRLHLGPREQSLLRRAAEAPAAQT